ncbi:MAG: helix-turn-helix domain-containing protein, partial [Cryobacterium sp.]|nr:helix-turn-helix domain-containing protein [Cryobacterium sp.]
FASAMKRFRVEKGLSQEALADVSGLHRTYISSVERGARNIGVDNIERIALALNEPIALFFPLATTTGRET